MVKSYSEITREAGDLRRQLYSAVLVIAEMIDRPLSYRGSGVPQKELERLRKELGPPDWWFGDN